MPWTLYRGVQGLALGALYTIIFTFGYTLKRQPCLFELPVRAHLCVSPNNLKIRSRAFSKLQISLSECYTDTTKKLPVWSFYYLLAQDYINYIRQFRYISHSTNNKMQRFSNLFISVRLSTCFGRFFRPSPGAQNAHTASDICQAVTATCC